ncbi:NifB/NifX family molybdenum-iron cluster-binding protein [Methanolobus sediminis]|uniref:NifB/NifX family molybdenum-iron cluster-binding protein n=1 Tax=Methanolobus sediminis TaxID=3072978 RepID=A0AA51YI80_9EURY|nr:NifB/NifX family molybdenum-iron cluster-binding protein [Methanolobus sediminis]WMW24235.1 NifB/NifX family molybdenum-iron cluster-binding protein [Methanolobus sediminis]
MMKLCIPSMGQNGMEDTVGQHFGKVPYYTLYDTETRESTVISNTSEHNGGTGLPPEIMANENVDIMLCGGLGRKAVMMFEQYGIDVFIGATGSIQDAVAAWEASKLSKATQDNSCAGHGHDHDHNHEHGHCH